MPASIQREGDTVYARRQLRDDSGGYVIAIPPEFTRHARIEEGDLIKISLTLGEPGEIHLQHVDEGETEDDDGSGGA